MTHVLRLADVSFAYSSRSPVLRSISVTVHSKELVILIGANGAGKSTLLRLASGFLRPDAGRVLIDDQPVSGMSARSIAQRLAALEQDRHVALDFTVREIVAMGRLPHLSRFGRERAEDRHAVDEALALTDTASLAARSIHSLSGGERQRALLATAIAQQPEFLVLDEPTTHLDIRYQYELLDIIRQQVSDGVGTLMALHDLNAAATFGDRIAVLCDGHIDAIGPPAEELSEQTIERSFGIQVRIRKDPDTGDISIFPRKSQ